MGNIIVSQSVLVEPTPPKPGLMHAPIAIKFFEQGACGLTDMHDAFQLLPCSTKAAAGSAVHCRLSLVPQQLL